jgi:hypothetical protein
VRLSLAHVVSDCRVLACGGPPARKKKPEHLLVTGARPLIREISQDQVDPVLAEVDSISAASGGGATSLARPAKCEEPATEAKA